MSINVRTYKKYEVEYASPCINGCEDIDKFIRFLRNKQSEGMDGIWISENEEDIEIQFSTLEELKKDKDWGKQIENIINDADKSNDFARLSIW